MLLRPDLTSRKFLCVGLDGENSYSWSYFFEIGKIYYEVYNPEFSIEQLEKQGILFLLTESEKTLLVDSSEFEEVDLKNKMYRKIINNAFFSVN